MTNTELLERYAAGDRDFQMANLAGANLISANLANANLRGANLTRANLAGANLGGVRGLLVASDHPQRLAQVANAALSPGNGLDMSTSHTCETNHCIAGWAIHLAGEPGRLLETVLGTEVAGLYLLGTEAHSHFHDDDEKAKEFLQSILDQQPKEVNQ